MYGLKQGNEVLKQLNKEMDLATVEKLMDDTREGIAYQEVRVLLPGFRMGTSNRLRCA